MMSPESTQSLARRVLVVDDDAAIRLMASVALASSGYDVIEAENGRQGVEFFKAHKPDLVLLDVMMPEMDGYEACEAIRALPGGEHVPLVIMTGLDDAESVARAYEIGATDFITKPLGHLLLINRLNFLLRATEMANELRASQERLNQAYKIARMGHWEWHPRTGRVWCSDEIYKIFDLDPDIEIHSLDQLLPLVHPDDKNEVGRTIKSALAERAGFSVEHRIITPSNEERVVVQEAAVVTSGDGNGRRLVGTVQDNTSRRRSEEQIRYLAYYDKLTGLPNRSLFTKYLSNAVANGRRYNRTVAVLFIDLDHFRRYNETLGQRVGDKVLREVSQRLRTCIRFDQLQDMQRETGQTSATSTLNLAELSAGCDAVGHLGGDEFVIALTETQAAEDAVFVVQRVRDALAKPFNVDGHELFLTASIGISAYPMTGDSADTLIRHAEAAARQAKAGGRDRHEFFSGTLNLRAFKKLSVETQLRKAIERNELEVHYQPRVNVQADKIVGMEALARLPASTGGYISPDEFIPVAEETGLILPLGEWVLNAACRQTRSWQQRGMGDLKVSVNLSGAQFKRKDFSNHIASTLAQVDLAPEFLELELTEGMLIDDTEASIAVLRSLRRLGVELAVDDFGTGYSSLAYLKRFPVHTLKIDRSFVKDLAQSGQDAAIVSAVVALAHGLGLNVVAEGAEQTDQLDRLRTLDCDEVQGQVYAGAMSAEAFENWVIDWRQERLVNELRARRTFEPMSRLIAVG